jgi:hypothetical protein
MIASVDATTIPAIIRIGCQLKTFAVVQERPPLKHTSGKRRIDTRIILKTIALLQVRHPQRRHPARGEGREIVRGGSGQDGCARSVHCAMTIIRRRPVSLCVANMTWCGTQILNSGE